MSFQNIHITEIRINRFAGKRDILIRPAEKTNVFIGHNCCGKTSVCDFIRFMFYGVDGHTDIYPWNGDKRLSGELRISADGIIYTISRTATEIEERVKVTDNNGAPVAFYESPGKYFLGCDSYIYDRTVYLPQKQNSLVQSDLTDQSLALNALDSWAEAFCDRKGMYSEYHDAVSEKNALMNEEKTGEIDRLLAERREFDALTEQRSSNKAREAEALRSLEEIQKRMASNNKRMVILKADMKNYADDIKLMENAENAGSLKAEIQQNEKRRSLLAFEAKKVHSSMTKETLAALKADYSEYSRLDAECRDASGRLSLAKENFELNRKPFPDDDQEEEIRNARASLDSKRSFKNLFASFSALFVIIAGFAFAFLYFYIEKDLLFALLITVAVLVFSAILGVCSSLFKRSAKNVLASLNLDSMSEFDDLCEQFNSYKKSDDIYREAYEKAEDEAKALDLHSADALEKIKNDISESSSSAKTLEISLSAPKEPELSASDILSRADLITAKYDELYEAEARLAAQKEQYRVLLSTDIKKDTLEISEEFTVLERELSFLSKQNDVLYEKQNELEAKLLSIRAEVKDIGDIGSLVTKNENDMLTQLEKYRAVQFKCDSLARQLDLLEEKNIQPVSARLNALISFALKPGESFVLGEHFELKYKRGSQTLPFRKAGGGLSELAMIALRIAFSEQLIKTNVPMIFDESFIFIDKDNAKRLCRTLEAEARQILVFTSSESDCAGFFNQPKIFTDTVFGEAAKH